VVVVLHDPGGEAGSEEVARAGVPSVEALRVAAMEVLDAGAQLCLAREDEQVHMASHEAEGVDLPLVAAYGSRQQLEIRAAVAVVPEEEGAVDAARRDVEDAVRQLCAQNTWQDGHGSSDGQPISQRGNVLHTLVTLAVSRSANPQGQTLIVPLARGARAVPLRALRFACSQFSRAVPATGAGAGRA